MISADTKVIRLCYVDGRDRLETVYEVELRHRKDVPVLSKLGPGRSFPVYSFQFNYLSESIRSAVKTRQSSWERSNRVWGCGQRQTYPDRDTG